MKIQIQEIMIKLRLKKREVFNWDRYLNNRVYPKENLYFLHNLTYFLIVKKQREYIRGLKE